MGIEVPSPLQPGESISLEQLFKFVGTKLEEQGLLPEDYATDQWAEEQATTFKSEYSGKNADGKEDK